MVCKDALAVPLLARSAEAVQRAWPCLGFLQFLWIQSELCRVVGHSLVASSLCSVLLVGKRECLQADCSLGQRAVHMLRKHVCYGHFSLAWSLWKDGHELQHACFRPAETTAYQWQRVPDCGDARQPLGIQGAPPQLTQGPLGKCQLLLVILFSIQKKNTAILLLQ